MFYNVTNGNRSTLKRPTHLPIFRSCWNVTLPCTNTFLVLSCFKISDKIYQKKLKEHVQIGMFAIHSKFVHVYSFIQTRLGYIIAVTAIESIGDGITQSGQNLTVYPVKYKAIVFRPYVGQVLDAVVTVVTQVIYISTAHKQYL